MENRHQSVLFSESIEALQIEASDVVVDGTIGGAGHFAAIRDRLDSSGTLIGIDADADALTRAEALPAQADAPTVHLVNDNFRNLGNILDTLGIEKIDKSLFDLGWSSFHLSSGRGFSFKSDEPLLMTYGEPEEGRTAADLVNSGSEEALADIIYTFGEERFARSIARSIVRARSEERILTTAQLVDAVMAGTPAWYHNRRIHPATKTFQALRIAVNDELGAVRDGLCTAISRTKPGGRIAVITFHSIEDRVVKSMFRDAAYAGKGSLVNRKPIIPSSAELAENPRARSAKLRVFECGETTSGLAQALTQTLYVYA